MLAFACLSFVSPFVAGVTVNPTRFWWLSSSLVCKGALLSSIKTILNFFG